METILWVIIIFVMEFVLSSLLNSNSIAIISRKPWRATKLSLVANALYWARFYIIGGLSHWSIPLMGASAIGDVLGDLWVASRKRKKKDKKPKKKITFSTA